MANQSNYSLFKTIFSYVVSDIKKKPKGFGIGVFTIFLVVAFIVALKSIVEVSPLALLKVGQD